nr:hypothetical protein [uncultured bacterium]
MTNPTLNFLVIVLYLAGASVLAFQLLRGDTPSGARRGALFALAAVAIALHALILFGGMHAGLNLSFTGALALVSWTVACLYLIVSLRRPIDNLGVFILPIAALTVLVDWLRPTPFTTPLTSYSQAIHIVVALVAYSLMCLAAVQSVMLLAQDNQLRHKHTRGFVRALPSVQQMEEVMFQMIGLGFVLLTVTLISGVFFSERVFATPFKLTHHIVLAALAWAVYAVLLLGRWRFGWRGRTAVRWTIGGFALLVLAYFGTKFVLEVVLRR